MKAKTKKLWLITIPLILASIGAINWGFVGLMNFNLVTAILGNFPGIVTAVYILVGVSGVLGLAKVFGWIKSK